LIAQWEIPVLAPKNRSPFCRKHGPVLTKNASEKAKVQLIFKKFQKMAAKDRSSPIWES
jgi:hypothetical protein